MIERSLSFDSAAHSIDAVQRAAYRFTDRLSCEISSSPTAIEVKVSIPDDDADVESVLADFRNEVLDQVLRERIRGETEDVRNLVLALAFSKTSLSDASDV
jgi:His-Xaa-Ser system protein HxsD